MLNLEPLLQASPAIQIHVFTAITATATGLFILLTPKGTGRHRLLGRTFVVAMGLTAVSSFFIHEIRALGSFSMIHLLSIFVLFSLAQAIRAIRCGKVQAHKQAMLSVYVGGIVIAGGFTFLPGRMMAEVTYGGVDNGFPVLWLFSALAAVWLMTWLFKLWRSSEYSNRFRSR